MRTKLRNILFLAIAACCASALVGMRAPAWFGSTWAPAAALLIALSFATTLAIPFRRALQALQGLDDDLRDLSNGKTNKRSSGGAGETLAARVEHVGALIEASKQSAQRSEILLHASMDEAPMAILLLADAGEIEYANQAARTLFFDGADVAGTNFLALLSDAPAPLREAVLGSQDRLFTVPVGGAMETYHLSKRTAQTGGDTHTLLVVKHLTPELRQQELETWKKLIRVVSHEINNSMAPVTSLVHSARILAKVQPDDKLGRVFSTIEERAQHLQSFVDGYARFARLPKPRREEVRLADFLAHVATLAPFAQVVPATDGATASFDRSQVEQVAINLLKNAHESGGPENGIELALSPSADGGFALVVRDRGPGMSPEVLGNALLPFYSTKAGGTGLGLALCREITEAHGGSINLANRDDGGLQVTCMFPGPGQPAPRPAARLSLSRV